MPCLARLLLLAAMLFTAAPALAEDAFRDCADCPLMRRIPAGSFLMGVSPQEEEAADLPRPFRGRSVPQTRITFDRGFALGLHAVTRGQYRAFVQATGRRRGEACWTFAEVPGSTRMTFRRVRGLHWEAPGFAQTEDDPVVCVSWNDAQAYAAWMARQTGRRYRLPSEAEWEYAARAGNTGARYWSEPPESYCRQANLRDRAMAAHYRFALPADIFDCDDGHIHTAPVGSFPPNGFGLHDMLGNVWQWTQDCWNRDLTGQPTDGSPRLSGQCGLRIWRGGSWLYYPRYVRAGFRFPDVANCRLTDTGFRLARDD